jgi:Protein of unknown function (DUF1706)
MSDKQEVLQAADEAYAELRQAVSGLDEEQMAQPWLGTWGVREILVHSSGWHREMAPALTRIGRGERPYPDGEYDDADAWNARFVEARREAKTAAILDELEASHREFLAVAAALPDGLFAPGMPARELFEGSASAHYREHAAQIRAWRREPSGSAEGDQRVTERTDPMLEALYASQPNQALASKLQLYGQFVGSWELECELHPLIGPARRAEGEWHFNWVLDGKAIQDVWIFPARRLRGGEKPAEPWHMYGSTFRWYDPAIDAWHITWFDPTRPAELRQIGRAVGADIVQIGEDHHGVLSRWRFVEITRQSFRWLGETSWDKGATWRLILEMRARKVS